MTQLIGVFDLFRIGLGPSSSHTVGPMRAAASFLRDAAALTGAPSRVEIILYGSLAWTGKGHGTDIAVLAGLSGLLPETADPDDVITLPARIQTSGMINLPGIGNMPFDPTRDLVFDRVTPTTLHPNALRFRLYDAAQKIVADQLWFSIGGGFVLRDGDAPAGGAPEAALPYPFRTAREMLEMAAAAQKTVAGLQRANECAVRPPAELSSYLEKIADAMESCIDRGLAGGGELPGGLKVRRRAKALAERLARAREKNVRRPNEGADHASLWAIAVNEENAAGGRVVTAPTNGAAGVIPAVLRYWRAYYEATPEATEDFFLAAAAIGGLAKRNASISGAEVGCQGEVGVACAMAAAGLASALGGTPGQVENAAEIGLEHHLGMTCDPIGGLVQIPCIERNAMGAIKAINAASLALSGDGTHRVSLDEAIATMRQTGLDMHDKYKETAQGGLAVHVTEC
jgi:L-serine dehydratase